MRSELYKYTKEEIIEAIEHVCKAPDRLYIRSMIINRMDDIREETRQNEFFKLMDQRRAACEKYFEAHKKYNSYLFEIAKKYNILNDDNTFKIGDFFGKATEQEIDTAISLERDRKKKYEEYMRLDRTVDINLGRQKGYHEKKS